MCVGRIVWKKEVLGLGGGGGGGGRGGHTSMC